MRNTMKVGSGLIAATAVFIIMAAPPAFARVRHPSHKSSDQAKTESQLALQEMRITNSPTAELIVAPPVTAPAWSFYDTPNPPAPSDLPAVPEVVAETAPAAASTTTVANATPPADKDTPVTASSASLSNAAAHLDAVVDDVKVAQPAPEEKADATKVDGATTHLDATQVVPTTLPSGPQLQQAVAAASKTSQPSPGVVLFDNTHDDSPLDPTNWAVNICKTKHQLTVYYKGRLFKIYDAVFGRNLDNGAKEWEHDRRTPEGVYSIIAKYPSDRFKWFLRLNYPNLVDRVRYETMRINGVVPVDGQGRESQVGGAIGIHGTDVPILNEGHINWTTGCISVSNHDIDDLDRLLPVGTVVIIKP